MRLLIPRNEKRSVASLFTDSETNIGEASFGGVIPLEVGIVSRLANPTSGRQWSSMDLTGWTIRAAIGIPFQVPKAGGYTLTFDSVTTALLAFDATAAQIATALQTIVGAAAAITVSGSSGYFIVTILPTTNHTYAQILGDASDLAPLSIIETGIIIPNVGASPWEQVQTIRVVQNAAAENPLTVASAAPGATVTVLQVGGGGHNHKIRVTLTPLPYDGRWSITISAGESGLLAWDISAADLVTALVAMPAVAASADVSVFREEEGVYLIGFQGALANTNMGTITVDASALRVLSTLSGELDLRTPGIESLLGNAGQVAAFFEVEGTPPGGDPEKLYHAPINVIAPVIDPATLTPQPRATFYTKAEIDALGVARRDDFLSLVTGYTGGGATNLDGTVTVGLSVPRLYKFVRTGEGLRFYALRAGTDAESSPAIIRPDDYNGATNAKVFESVL